jgi:hypothetical protein
MTPHGTGRLVVVGGRVMLGATDVLADDLLRLEPALKWRTDPPEDTRRDDDAERTVELRA